MINKGINNGFYFQKNFKSMIIRGPKFQKSYVIDILQSRKGPTNILQTKP